MQNASMVIKSATTLIWKVRKQVAKHKVYHRGSSLGTLYSQKHLGVYGILYMYRGKTHEGFYNKKVHPSYVKNACKYIKVLWEFENSRIWF